MDSAAIAKYLQGKFELAVPVLFTGAGFSRAAHSKRGSPLPLGPDLAKDLWSIAFPGEQFDERVALQDAFHAALKKKRTAVRELLRQRFDVDGDTLPAFYETWFSAPWYRCYTLNIDNLPYVANIKFNLSREPINISGLPGSTDLSASTRDSSTQLEVVHLHGHIDADPEDLTFSRVQFASRSQVHDPWYKQLATDLVTRPVVFVGSALDENVLWQHIELRKARGKDLSELRPKSFLVTPAIDRAKELLLDEYNVTLVKMKAEEFAQQVLEPARPAFAAGMKHLARTKKPRGHGITVQLPEVSTLVTSGTETTKSVYLMGQEPQWSDLQAGLAIRREHEGRLGDEIDAQLSAMPAERKVVLITGTAGSGKTTSLMRQGLRLASSGRRVVWLDRECDYSLREIAFALKSKPASGAAILIDDAEAFGGGLSELVSQVLKHQDHPLLILSIRAGQVDRALQASQLDGVPFLEHVMPALDDSDIRALLDLLDKQNLLGILKGKSRQQQEAAFRDHAGRHLLVAMYEATSGQRFEEKVVEEYQQLQGISQLLYGLTSVAHYYGHSIARDELLIASGDQTNEALNAIEVLARRQLVVHSVTPGTFRSRHKMVSELLVEHLSSDHKLLPYIRKLAFVAAARINPQMHRDTRAWRLLKKLTNHGLLARIADVSDARKVYDDLEQLLSWDYHFWLQRGSLEVEFGILNMAENYLNQAFSLAPDDAYVLTERGYLLFRKAVENPTAPAAPDLADEAMQILLERIDRNGAKDPYPYHVLGAQGLAWSRKALMSRKDRNALVRTLLAHVEAGLVRHRGRAELKQLQFDLKKEILALG